MTSKIKIQLPASMVCTALSIAFLVAAALAAPMAGAQTPSLVRGTVTTINGSALTLKTDAGAELQVEVPATASIKQVAPGQKDLSSAETIKFSDLATGDRVLVWPDPNATGSPAQALRIVAIKQADLAEKQAKDREDWQLRSVGGLVKSVDAAAGVIMVTSGFGATARTITVKTTDATVLKRYAPASVSYDAAQTEPIDTIHSGDQLRARGAKNADNTEIAADEVVTGTFRNISGTILSLDKATSTLILKDLTTKKPVTIHITADVQMRRLQDTMARMLAARLKGGAATGGSSGARSGYAGGAGSQRGAGGSGQWSAAGAAGQGPGGGDTQQMLSRAPAIQFADLKKGDAVMLVATDGTTDVTAITLLAGVEPLLESPAASQNLLSNWSMSSGSEAAAQ
jgi:uncharacterized membrane protein YgcG